MRIIAFLLLASPWSWVLAVPGQREATDYFRKWLMEDVLYIITPEEREVFSRLQRPEEKERFIEQFWQRRDPTPGTARNEFKEEHYRRIAYANAHFTSGFPGWKTDRGMIYVKFGPPDRIEAHPTGGDYQRPSWEGGGSTSTYPFERWEYRSLGKIGDDIEIEFVDDTLSGEYRIATHSDEKDALLRTPNAGLTDAEMQGLVEQKLDRIVRKTNPMPGHNPIASGYGRLKDQPFEKLMLISSLEKAPALDLKELKSQVRTQVYFNQFPFQVRSDVFQKSEVSGQVVLTLYFKNKDLSFQRDGQIYSTQLELYGVFKDLSGRIIAELEDGLVLRVPSSELHPGSEETIAFQKESTLPPGRFKLELFVRQVAANKLGASEVLIVVPDFRQQQLSTSSLMLARRIETVPAAGSRTGGARYKVWPVVENKVPVDSGKLGLYYEAYNLGLDAVTQKPHLEVSYELIAAGAVVYRPRIEFHTSSVSGRKVDILTILSTQGMSRGEYTLRIILRDGLTDQQLTKTQVFRLE